MTRHDFVEYVKNHKKEIALGALGLVGTGLLVAVGVKVSKSTKINGGPVEMIGDIASDWQERNLVDGFTTGKVNDLWNDRGCGNGMAIVQYFTVKDMGNLGEDLKKIGGITGDTEVSAILSFVDTEVEI